MEKRGILVAFSIRTEKIKNSSEKSKFFKELYGWTQIVPKDNRTYSYYREGILDRMPHLKVDQSSFIVPEDKFEEIIDFFEEWSNKVIWKTFKVLLDRSIEKEFEEWEEE
ncbi:MAG: hypothetical protein QXO57_00640 [Candidatus Aenigmatarchaeota archaeon]|nr:hypothetical protein [Candidatus Aenigmarchaeota archaeon]